MGGAPGRAQLDHCEERQRDVREERLLHRGGAFCRPEQHVRDRAVSSHRPDCLLMMRMVVMISVYFDPQWALTPGGGSVLPLTHVHTRTTASHCGGLLVGQWDYRDNLNYRAFFKGLS